MPIFRNPRRQTPQRQCSFESVAMLSQLLSDVHMGDLVFFSDRYWITSNLTRLATHSQWTHLGVIVRFPWIDDIFLWEVSHSIFALPNYLLSLAFPTLKRTGVRLIRLEDKLRYFPARGNRLTIVRLHHQPAADDSDCLVCDTARQNAALAGTLDWWYSLVVWCMRCMSKAEFRSSSWTFVKAAWRTHFPLDDHHLLPNFTDRDHQRSLGYDGVPLVTAAGQIDYERMRRILDTYLDRQGGRIFCSEAVALLWHVLGLLDPGYRIRPWHFVPRDFMPVVRRCKQDDSVYLVSAKVPLSAHWELRPYVSLHLTLLEKYRRRHCYSSMQ